MGYPYDPTNTLWLCTDTALALILSSTTYLPAAIDKPRL